MSGSRGELLGDRDPVLCSRVIHPEHPAKLVINSLDQFEKAEDSQSKPESNLSHAELTRQKRLERFG